MLMLMIHVGTIHGYLRILNVFGEQIVFLKFEDHEHFLTDNLYLKEEKVEQL